MPFVTEEVWQTLPHDSEEGLTADGQARSITRAAYPQKKPAWVDDGAVAVLELLQEVITSVRTVRAELGVPPKKALSLLIEQATDDEREILQAHGDYLRRLAGLEAFAFPTVVARDPDTVRRVVRQMRLYLPLAGIIDREAEADRIKRELDKVAKQLRPLEARLANQKFRERADPDVVSEAEAKQEALLERGRQLEQILAELDA